MSINYQINNIFHTIQYQTSKSVNINYIKAESFYDLAVNELENINIFDHNVVNKKFISYGLTFINNVMSIANNAQTVQEMYSNKIIFIHNSLINYLKKEDQFILFNSIKNYPVYSFVSDVKNIAGSINYIKYGFEDNIKTSSADRNIDILLLYQQENKKQTEILFRSLKQISNKTVDIVCSNNITSNEVAINLFNNAKICIDTSSYYNLLMSASCGCIPIGFNLAYDKEIIKSEQNLEDMPKAALFLSDKHDDKYIQFAQNYIQSNYNYKNYIDNVWSIIDYHLNLEVTL